MTAKRYSRELNKFYVVLDEKRPFTGQGTRKVTLLHDNVQPHVAHATQQTRDGQVDSDSFEESILECRFFDSLESILESRESIPRIDASSESTSIPITELRKNKFSLS